jgi:hypothetical protein
MSVDIFVIKRVFGLGMFKKGLLVIEFFLKFFSNKKLENMFIY